MITIHLAKQDLVPQFVKFILTSIWPLPKILLMEKVKVLKDKREFYYRLLGTKKNYGLDIRFNQDQHPMVLLSELKVLILIKKKL